MTEDEFAELSAGAALGALGDDDLRAYRQALAEHPEWERLAQDDADTAAGLAELGDEVAPPTAVRESILARIDTSSPGASPRAGEEGEERGTHRIPRAGRRRVRRRWLVLAASIVVLAGIGTATVIAVQQANRPAVVVALDRIEDAPDAQQATGQVDGGGQATLHWSVSAGEAVLVTGRMPRLSDGTTFELWYVRGDTPIPAGTFDASGATTSARLSAGMRPGDVIAVTVERAGGSPTGKPTSEPILAIPTA